MALGPNEPALPRAITVRADLIDMGNRRGPDSAHYNMPLDRGRTYRWEPGSILDADGIAVIASNGAGSPGRWLLVREPVLGADLADVASQTINVGDTGGDGGDYWRRFPAASQLSTVTLGTVNAEAGDVITITRTDLGVEIIRVLNGGVGGGTLVTFPGSAGAFGDFYFDGADWLKMRAAAMLA